MMKKQEIQLGIAEDHTMFRKAICAFISQFESCGILFEAGNGLEVQEELKKGKIPDIILMDLKMPGMNGFETLNWLSELHPSVSVIIVSMYDSDYNIIRALKSGAKAFLKKTKSPNELKNAIYSVKEKGYYYTDIISRKLFSIFYNDSENDFDFRKYTLNEKETHFLKLASSELTYKEIAREMRLSMRAVDKIRDRMFFKFDVKNRVSLAMKATDEGITL